MASSATEGIDAVRIVEKPSIRHFVNAGIYLIQPGVCQMVPPDRAYDMPDLITSLIGGHKRVSAFPYANIGSMWARWNNTSAHPLMLRSGMI